MKNSKDIEVDLSLGLNSREVPIELPCHAYATGILENYYIGELIGSEVTKYTRDCELLEIFLKEIETLGLILKQTNDKRSIQGKKRVFMITRLYIERGDFLCRDYHFRLFMEDGNITEKYRDEKPKKSEGLIPEEYSLGIYSLEKML